MNLTIDKSDLDALSSSIAGTKRKLEREVKTVVNKVAAQVALEASRRLATVVPLKLGTLKKIVRQKSKATPDSVRAHINVGKGYPIPLRLLKPTQLKRGVTYKKRKDSKREVIRDAFILQQYGGHVYKRVGQSSRPIVKQFGPAPGDFFEELNIEAKAIATAKAELKKQMQERIRFLLLERAGGLKR